MALRPIIDYTQPILRQKALRVERVDARIRRLVRDMRETMKAAPGVGLAAPQVGERLQVLVYEVGEERGCLINPVVESESGERTDTEGCLSIPGLQGDVTRAAEIVVSGLDDRGRPIRLEAEEYLARTLQHEIDHLNGVLFIDRAIPETLQRIDPLKRPGGKTMVIG